MDHATDHKTGSFSRDSRQHTPRVGSVDILAILEGALGSRVVRLVQQERA